MRRFRLPFLLILCWVSHVSAEDRLEARLAPLAKSHKGHVAIAVKHLATGEQYFFHADEIMPTASLIKVAILLETYKQAEEGKTKLTETRTLRPDPDNAVNK